MSKVMRSKNVPIDFWEPCLWTCHGQLIPIEADFSRACLLQSVGGKKKCNPKLAGFLNPKPIKVTVYY